MSVFAYVDRDKPFEVWARFTDDEDIIVSRHANQKFAERAITMYITETDALGKAEYYIQNRMETHPHLIKRRYREELDA
jgi:hypothetical protein